MNLFEYLYYIGYSLDKRLKLQRQKRLPYPVISIGNITVGGTGKTPTTIAIAQEAKKRGFFPIILTRGYKGKAKGPCLVETAKGSSLLYGDEPLLMAERLRDVPIVKCSDRYKGGVFFLKAHESAMSHQPIFILDDGFQHWRLYRNIDIVLIDGTNPFGNRKMLPVGPLREPLNELRRADIYVITKTNNETLLDELKDINPHAPVYFSRYRVSSLRDFAGNKYPIDILRDRKIYAFCGIANPDSFRQTVLSLSGRQIEFKAYKDHHKYARSDIDYLMRQNKHLNCDFFVTTEKDMVKLKELNITDKFLYIEIEFYVDSSFYDSIFNYPFSTRGQI